MRFTDNTLDTLKERADAAAIIGDHVQLKRSGSGLKGLCPFHNEKTPSFHVDPHRGWWRCYGACNTSGDLIRFVQELHSVTFVEAVEHLADKTGVPLERIEDDGSDVDNAPRQSRRRLTDAIAAAADWYHQQLHTDAGRPALDYLHQRGFTTDDITRHQLGFAPSAGGLVAHLATAGYTDDELLAADLAAANDHGRLYDRFRGRLQFPIRDHTATPIGFGARVVPGVDDDRTQRPKYLNTAETALYRKSKTLYGLDLAVHHLRRNHQALLVEGYTDVVALTQAGIDGVVATCGTALTDDHVALLVRLGTRHCVLAFDADAAGTKAAERAFAAAAGTDLDLRVLPLPPGSDPADWAAQVGADEVAAATDRAVPAGRWLIRTALAGHDLAFPEGRRAAAKDAVRVIGLITDPLIRAEYLSYATDEGLPHDLLHRVAADDGIALARAITPTLPATRPHDPARPTVATDQLTNTRTQLEADVLWIAMHRPQLLPEQWWDAEGHDFLNPLLRLVFKTMDHAGGAGVDVDAYVEAAGTDRHCVDAIRKLHFRPPPIGLDGVMADQAVRTLLLPRIDAQIAALQAQLAETRDEYDGLLTALSRLQAQRRELADGPGTRP